MTPQLVSVFESNDRFVIGLAKAALEDAGIAFWIQGNQTEAQLALSPIMFPSCRFLVSSESEEEAREVLDLLESPES